MKHDIVNFLRTISPFLVTVGLWRLSDPFWNPAGVLAIIPVFFCSFVKPVNWFPLFSVIMCMCIDYNFETVCLWMAVYCLFFAINGFQTVIDITRQDNNAVFAFMVFCGCAITIIMFTNFTFDNVWRGLWMFSWLAALYIPFTKIIQRMRND